MQKILKRIGAEARGGVRFVRASMLLAAASALSACATEAEMAQRRIQMQQEMVQVRANRAAMAQTLANPQVATTVGQVIGCAIAGGCPSPQTQGQPGKELDCRSRGFEINGSPVYRCN